MIAASPRDAYIKTTGKKNPNIVYISKWGDHFQDYLSIYFAKSHKISIADSRKRCWMDRFVQMPVRFD